MRDVRVALLAALFAVACGKRAGDGDGKAPARIIELVGPTEVERAGEVAPAAVGTELFFGDLVRTGDGASARVRFAGGQTVRLGERTLLRLGQDARSSAQISVAVGEAELDGTGVDGSAGAVTVATPRGPARLAEGARVRVRADPGSTRFEVMVGRASLGEPDDGASAAAGLTLALGTGDGLSIAIGGAVVERYRVKVGAVELEPAEAAPRRARARAGREDAAADDDPDGGLAAADEATAAADDGTVARDEAALSTLVAARGDASSRGFDVGIAAGESAVVHAERAPVAVRLRLPPGCAATTARLRWSPRRPNPGSADGAVHLLAELPAGTFRYRLYCTGQDRDDTARGTLTVRRDTGAAPLPRRPPHNRLDADGRRYTVLFQNHLPAFSLSWPRLVGRAPYTLVIESRSQTRKLTARRPTYQLRAGALPEGNHSFYWESADGQRSATSTLTLRFDNAALAAEIQLPRPNGARLVTEAGAPRIDVKGVTLPGSRVSVNEGPLPVDAQGRFRAEVSVGQPPPRTIAIRVDHPRTGTHHYLRRLRAGK